MNFGSNLPEVKVDTTALAPEDAAEMIVAHLRVTGVLDPIL